jgi:hypothetical protein
MRDEIRVGVLGAGGLGRNAARVLSMKEGIRLVAICDQQGFAYDEKGISAEAVEALEPTQSVGLIEGCGQKSEDSIGEMIRLQDRIDGFLLTLPNLPNDFMPGVVERFLDSGYKGTFVDALKRTRAMEITLELDEKMKAAGAVYITGAGATPGLLSAAAVLAAQSFVEVESVDIWWGVGISNWDAYRATIREDIAHLPGYTVESARALSDVQVGELLDKTEGKLTLKGMEHADDILLQRAGVVRERDQVQVGGVMNTRSARKPVSTTMSLTGITFEGKRATHKFVLGDETSMAANVLGPMLGYLKRAVWLKERGIHGVFGSTEFMPMPLPGRYSEKKEKVTVTASTVAKA